MRGPTVLLSLLLTLGGCVAAAPEDDLEAIAIDPTEELGKADGDAATRVELKVTLAPQDIGRARRSLRLWGTDADAREITFYDTVELDLLRAGIVLRSREREDEDDSTVKLRPLAASDVEPRWHELDGFKCEVDRLPDRSVQSCSLTVEQDEGEIDEVAAGERDVDRLFSGEQEDFLRDHASIEVDLDELAVLGPVRAQVWRRRSRALGHELTFELWTLPDGSRALEVSLRADADDADEVQEELLAYLASRGLSISESQETKTRLALEQLAARAR